MARKTGLFLGLCLSVSVVLGQEKEMKFAFDNYHRYSNEAKACTDPAKKEAMVKLRTYFHRNPYRLDKVDMPLPPQKCLELLTERGTFSDMEATEREFEQKGTYQKGFRTTAEGPCRHLYQPGFRPHLLHCRRISSERTEDGKRCLTREITESGGTLRDVGDTTSQ